MEFFNTSFNDNNIIENGFFLLAEPFLDDPNFDRTVVLICQNDKQGSFGLVVNRPTEVRVNEATSLSEIENRLFVGGPVQQNTMHFLHKIHNLEDALPLTESVFWGGNVEHLQTLALKGSLTEENCRFFVGYSGWAEQQLEAELEQNTWIISKVNPNIIFDHAPENLWTAILRKMGGKYKVFSNYPPDPSLN